MICVTNIKTKKLGRRKILLHTTAAKKKTKVNFKNKIIVIYLILITTGFYSVASNRTFFYGFCENYNTQHVKLVFIIPEVTHS